MHLLRNLLRASSCPQSLQSSDMNVFFIILKSSLEFGHSAIDDLIPSLAV